MYGNQVRAKGENPGNEKRKMYKASKTNLTGDVLVITEYFRTYTRTYWEFAVSPTVVFVAEQGPTWKTT
jgi:hypothetical protein